MVGPTFNREVLTGGNPLRRTGIWPLKGPDGSAQSNLRANSLMARGSQHVSISRSAAPCLDRKSVAGYFDAAKRIVAGEVAEWPVGASTDIYRHARHLAQHLGFALIFGETDRARMRFFGEMLRDYHAANWSRFAALFPVDWPGTAHRRLLRQAETLQDFILTWSASPDPDPDPSAAYNLRTAFARMPGAEPHRTAAYLAGYALGSYETIATTLTWALVLLASLPEMANRLLAELEHAGPIAEMESAVLNGLPLLDGFLRETMRIATPVPFLCYRTTQDCAIAGQDLPERALVIVSPHLTHRLARIYVDPRRFRPDRWLEIKPDAYEYLPFGGGPRRCPGHFFADSNLKIALATIVPKLKLSIPGGTRISRAHSGVTVPARGATMRVEAQDGHPLPSARRGSFFDLVTV